MLKYEIEKGHPKLSCIGTEAELSADVMVLIKMLHEHFCCVSPELGQLFISDLVYCMTDENSPLYKEAENDAC